MLVGEIDTDGFTVSVKVCCALGETPLLAVITGLKVPDCVGVPLSTAGLEAALDDWRALLSGKGGKRGGERQNSGTEPDRDREIAGHGPLQGKPVWSLIRSVKYAVRKQRAVISLDEITTQSITLARTAQGYKRGDDERRILNFDCSCQ